MGLNGTCVGARTPSRVHLSSKEALRSLSDGLRHLQNKASEVISQQPIEKR